MRDGPNESASAPARTPEEREQLKRRFANLKTKRSEIERSAEAVTEQIHLLLREAHEAGWSWAEIAEIADYRNGAVARAQAARAGDVEPAPLPPDSYTVREAAERLGVSVQSVYASIRAGRIIVADDRAKGRRVYLPDSGTSD